MATVSTFLGSWQHFQPALWVDPALVFFAVLCGILIGGERERHEKPAGLRTLSLVCLGSAVFTMLSFTFSSNTGDSGRVAAQIVTGIGFLGAGVILHGRRIVSGVTTAGIIWVAAAIGMAVGAGYAIAGLALALLVNRLMVFIFLFETRWHPDLLHVSAVVEFDPERGKTRVRLESILVNYELRDAEMTWREPSANTGSVTIDTKLARLHLNELLAEIADVPGVKSITRERMESNS